MLGSFNACALATDVDLDTNKHVMDSRFARPLCLMVLRQCRPSCQSTFRWCTPPSEDHGTFAQQAFFQSSQAHNLIGLVNIVTCPTINVEREKHWRLPPSGSL